MSANVMILLYATIAAVGNALLSYGQKKAAPVSNLYFFLGAAALVFFVCNIIAGFVTKTDSISASKILSGSKELFWAIVCGVALFVLYFAINNLLVKYGASMYVVYSVVSIFTTSIVVGVCIFKEKINIWHVLGIIMSCVAVALITIGNGKK